MREVVAGNEEQQTRAGIDEAVEGAIVEADGDPRLRAAGAQSAKNAKEGLNGLQSETTEEKSAIDVEGAERAEADTAAAAASRVDARKRAIAATQQENSEDAEAQSASSALPDVPIAKKPKVAEHVPKSPQPHTSSAPQPSVAPVLKASQLPKNGPSEFKNTPGTRLFIGNFASEGTSADELVEIFSRYGTIIEQPTIRKSYAFVQYDSPEPVLRAIAAENHRTENGLSWELSIAGTRPAAASTSALSASSAGAAARYSGGTAYSTGAGVGVVQVRVMAMGTQARGYAERVSRAASERLALSSDVVSTDREQLRTSLRTAQDARIPVVLVVAGRDERTSVCSMRTLELTGYEKVAGRSELPLEEALALIRLKCPHARADPAAAAAAAANTSAFAPTASYGWSATLQRNAQPPPPAVPPPRGKNTWFTNSLATTAAASRNTAPAPAPASASAQQVLASSPPSLLHYGPGAGENGAAHYASSGAIQPQQSSVPFATSYTNAAQHQPQQSHFEQSYAPFAPSAPFAGMFNMSGGVSTSNNAQQYAHGYAQYDALGGSAAQQSLSSASSASAAAAPAIDLAKLSGFLSSYSQAQAPQFAAAAAYSNSAPYAGMDSSAFAAQNYFGYAAAAAAAAAAAQTPQTQASQYQHYSPPSQPPPFYNPDASSAHGLPRMY
uniref:RRM domain-containing protein n=1 Tax=Erythrolobus australicus TaxID=1077150 RepID=A0A6T5WAM3_9RHOD